MLKNKSVVKMISVVERLTQLSRRLFLTFRLNLQILKRWQIVTLHCREMKNTLRQWLLKVPVQN